MKKIFTLVLIAVGFTSSAQYELYNNGAVLYVSTNATLQVNGSFINTTAGVDLENNGIITVTGNLLNDEPMSTYTGKVIFASTAAQVFSGASVLYVQNLEVNNPAGVLLNTKLKVDGVCTFTTGMVTASSAANALWFTVNGSHTGASDASHVNGYVVKEGTGSFDYPVGDATNYEKVTLNLSANAGGMQVKYTAADAGAASFGTTGASSTPLLFYNKKEYWDITPISTATGAVTVYWDAYNNVGIGNTADLRVAHLTGGSWLNESATAVTGTTASGSVTSAAISTWSPFTLGSISLSSALPLSWLSINGSLNNQNQAIIKWKVDESNVSRYDIEKSSDAASFSNAGSVTSKGNGVNDYSFTDAAVLKGTNYYRLRQTDIDGRYSYSTVIVLQNAALAGLSVYPSPFVSSFTVNSNKTQMASLVNEHGQIVRILQLKTGSNFVNAAALGSGLYYLKTGDGQTMKLIKAISK